MRNAQPSPRYMVKRISFLCSHANRLSSLGETKGGGRGQLLARFERNLRPPCDGTAATVKFEFNSENRTVFANTTAHLLRSIAAFNQRLKTARMIQKELWTQKELSRQI